MTEPTTARGSCHCGAIRFEATFHQLVAYDCNCSVCTKKGLLHAFVPRDRFALLEGADALQTYTFGTHTAKHHFCRTCGIHPFYVPRSHPNDWDVNVRCLDDPDVRARFEIRPFDGQNWESRVRELPPA